MKVTGCRKAVAGEQPPAGYRWLKAKGGYRWHIVALGSNRSACGHEPRNRSTMNRAGWWVLKDPAAGLMQFGFVCRACENYFCPAIDATEIGA